MFSLCLTVFLFYFNKLNFPYIFFYYLRQIFKNYFPLHFFRWIPFTRFDIEVRFAFKWGFLASTSWFLAHIILLDSHDNSTRPTELSWKLIFLLFKHTIHICLMNSDDSLLLFYWTIRTAFSFAWLPWFPCSIICALSGHSVTCSASLLAANHRCVNHQQNRHLKTSLDISWKETFTLSDGCSGYVNMTATSYC